MEKSILVIGLVLSSASYAQSYTIDRFKVAGGAGTSQAGVYSLRGTIGQHDAGSISAGGSYILIGGFWPLFDAVQTPGAPTLTIVLPAPGTARASWTPAVPGFVLQESISLSSPNWVNSASGATNPIVVPTLTTKFYRLFKF